MKTSTSVLIPSEKLQNSIKTTTAETTVGVELLFVGVDQSRRGMLSVALPKEARRPAGGYPSDDIYRSIHLMDI